jgi:threonyl-tRNA synthetase
VNLNLPERFDIGYISEAGKRVQPVMLHRALFGSLERFIGMLKKTGVRVVADLHNERVGYKVREHTMQRIRYLLMAGEQ